MRETTIRLLLSAAVTAALGFGAQQALASPAASGSRAACDEGACDYWCITQQNANVGYCVNGSCLCRRGP